MAKFWQNVLKVLIIVVIVAGLMLLITFLVPSVKEYAKDVSQNSKLPLWIVGLFAPIAYVFQRLKNWLTNLLGTGKTEKVIREENEAIKAEMTRLRQEVQALDEWRRESVHREITEINSLRQTLASMEGRSHGLNQRIKTLAETPASELIKDMTDEEIEREIERRNREMGIEEGELRRAS
jgi:cell division protein FtsB